MFSNIRRISIIGLLFGVFICCTGFRSLPNEINTGSLYIVEDNGSSIYMIGDSRLYMMRLATGSQAVNWLCECGSGYGVLMNQVVPVMDAEDLRGKTIIIEYGVNDILFLGGADSAITSYTYFFNNKVQEWIAKGATVKYIAVMPTCYPNVNAEIDRFNAAMVSAMPSNVRMVNLNNSVPFAFVDCVHFTDGVTGQLYNLMLTQ